jgi:hypothetical protein
MRRSQLCGGIVRALLLAISIYAATSVVACSAGRSEGLQVASLPVDIRPDYELFAERCSKCHSLARPLESGISDDTFWKEYVERMRRQPGSGISPADEVQILRFLHYYSLEKKAQQQPRTENAQ